ncbi:MAG: hypothetical protein HY921_11180 [Elusimicrobia bacterium]|nr:hypothetical protein [Elusimicrobiota bacterium]
MITFAAIQPGLAAAAPSPEFIIRNAIKLESPVELPDRMFPELKGYDVIILGEMHGTNEAPAFVQGLLRLIARNGRSAFLAVEIPAGEQHAIDSFLETGRIDILKKTAFFSRDFQDGRSSRAMAGLLEAVRSIPGVEVVCFDPGISAGAQERDSGMARNIKDAFLRLRKDHAVVLAGNVHASIGRGTSWDKNYRPMGYLLHAGPGAIFSQDEILAVLNRYKKGSAWVCSGGAASDCKETALEQKDSGYTLAVPWSSYFLKEPELARGYNATFFSRAITASAPLGRQ